MSYNQLLTAFFSIFVLILSRSAFAESSYLCQTTNKKYNLQIESGNIALSLHNTTKAERSIASSQSFNSNGIKKSFRSDGLLYTVTIENRHHFNANKDELTITNQDGHQVSYPIECFQ